MPFPHSTLSRKNNVLVWSKTWLNQTHTGFSDLPKRSLAQKPKLPTMGTFSFIQNPVILICSSPRARQTCAVTPEGWLTPHWKGFSFISLQRTQLTMTFFTSLSKPNYMLFPLSKPNVLWLAFSSATATLKPDWPGCDNYTFLVLLSMCWI